MIADMDSRQVMGLYDALRGLYPESVTIADRLTCALRDDLIGEWEYRELMLHWRPLIDQFQIIAKGKRI